MSAEFKNSTEWATVLDVRCATWAADRVTQGVIGALSKKFKQLL